MLINVDPNYMASGVVDASGMISSVTTRSPVLSTALPRFEHLCDHLFR